MTSDLLATEIQLIRERALTANSTQALFADLEDDLVEHLKQRVRKRLEKDISDDEVSESVNDVFKPNDSLVKQGHDFYYSAIKSLCRNTTTVVDFVEKVARLNNQVGVKLPVGVYRGVLKMGSVERYSQPSSYHKVAKRVSPLLSDSEIQQMLKLSKLISMFEKEKKGKS